MRRASILLTSWLMLSFPAYAQTIIPASPQLQNPTPPQYSPPPGIYTTKKDAGAPAVPPVYSTQPQSGFAPGYVPFGRASPDAMIPAPVGPRTTEAAPVGGVESDEVYALPEDAITASELSDAANDPTQRAPKESIVFEDATQKPHAVKLRALNKVTAHAMEIEIAPGADAHFGNLTITSLACRKTVEGSQPDAAALMKISEQKPGEEAPRALFDGWMFASTPSLTSLEHPIYDLSVVGCRVSG
jgi:hypothetical protein